MKVVCIHDKPLYGRPQTEWRIKKDEIYTIIGKITDKWGDWYELDIHPGVGYPVEHFAPIQTQYIDISKEIADSVKHTDEIPDKILIPEIAN